MRATVQIRLATPDETEALTQLINAAFVVEKEFIEGDRITVAEVEARMGKGQFLIMEDEGLTACVYVEPRGDRAYLGLLSVDPARQGGGLGTRMMAAAEEHARSLGCHAMDLNIVNLRRGLPEFYANRGYVQIGTAAFPADTPTKLPCHFIRMSKSLS